MIGHAVNFKSIKKWLLISVTIIAVLVILAFFWVNYELKQMAGAHTKVADYSQFESSIAPTAITNVSVLSPDGSVMIADQTVFLDRGKIISIGSERELPEGALVVNGQGRYLIPGLIDSHVHLWDSPNDLLLYVANGITHVREMNGSKVHLRWREEIESGRIGPRLFVASSRIDNFYGLNGWFIPWTTRQLNINSPEKAEAALKSIADEGYDAFKIYSFLKVENYEAINDASRKFDIPIVGHLSLKVGLEGLWESNQVEVAHIEEIVKALRGEFGRVTIENKDEFLAFVQDRSAEVARKLLEKEIAITSTMWLTQSFLSQKYDLETLLDGIELSYANPGITEGSVLSSRALGWLPDVNIYRLRPDLSEEQLATDRNYWDTYFKAHQILLSVFSDRGVQILAGTDSNLPVVVPGFALHDELKVMVQNGMSPSQALFSATAAPASWMESDAGIIAPGYRADMVLLRENPLEDIGNTTSIDAVFLNGRFLDRAQLDIMLDAVKEANDRSRKKGPLHK